MNEIVENIYFIKKVNINTSVDMNQFMYISRL